MSLLDPTLGNVLGGLGIAPDLLKPIPGLLNSVLDTVHGITETVGGITAGLGIPLSSLSLPGLGKILAVDPASVQDPNTVHPDASQDALYPYSALTDAISASPPTGIPTPEPSSSAGSIPKPNMSDNLVSTSSSSCNVEPYQPEVVAAILPSPNTTLSTVYRYRQQKSVNLGSLFVLEAWMVPSLFTCASQPAVSELDVANGWGGAAKAVLEKHWDTWITNQDFAWLSSIGINTVRLPIGYWHLGPEHTVGTPYENVGHVYEGAWPRVLRTVSMAASHGIGVLVDLHGAPGSQNGQHHSGISDGQAALFSDPANMDKTIDALSFLTKTFVNVPNVVGIQLLNEPNNVPELLSFYNRALDSLRSVTPEAGRFPFYVHDGFDLRRGTDYVESRSDWVVLDHHAYYVFTPSDMSMAASAHTNDINGPLGDELKAAGRRLNDNLVVDEWSCALASDSLKAEANPQASQNAFCHSQEDVYSRVGGGWSFWSYKKEGCDQDPSWCFANAVGKTLPPTFFPYDGLKSLTALDVHIFDDTPTTKRSENILSRLFPRARLAPPPTLTKDQRLHKFKHVHVRPSGRSINVAQDRISQDVKMPPLAEILAKAGRADADLPIGAVHGAATIHRSPPVPMNEERLYALNNAEMMKPMVDTDSEPVTPRARRFAAIQRRRAAYAHSLRPILEARSTVGNAKVQAPLNVRQDDGPSLTAEQRVMQRGYSDGFLTAKMFAQTGPAMSRLGFKGQYLRDTVTLLKGMGVIGSGDEASYEEWFWKGLEDGEGLVEKVIAAMSVPV